MRSKPQPIANADVKKSSENKNSSHRNSASRDAILDAAEMLFGQHGPAGVSLRQISTAAGSANNSAVQYHFKNKDGLIAGIYERRLTSLEKKRGELLQQVFEQRLEQDTRTLLEVLLRPIADEKDSTGQCSYAAFLLGLRIFGGLSTWALHSESAPVTNTLHGILRASLEPMDDGTFSTRRLCAVSIFLMSVVDWDRQVATGEVLPGSRDCYLRQVLDFAAAGMTAPWE